MLKTRKRLSILFGISLIVGGSLVAPSASAANNVNWSSGAVLRAKVWEHWNGGGGDQRLGVDVLHLNVQRHRNGDVEHGGSRMGRPSERGQRL